jgi:protein O-GlcNAc transferase
VKGTPALERGLVTFGSLNNFGKVNESVLRVWGEILRAVPKSELFIHAHEGSHRQRVWDRLEREGIEPGRVRFVGRLPAEKYFETYGQIDVALDTFPFGGGTTTCDALWMGVPVVSLAGATAVGRGGVSILSNIGLPELAAHSEEKYVRVARELAHDLGRLSELRKTLRRRMERSPVMNARRFTRNVEAAYRQMWREWCGTR